jgi:K+-sensing histidine kinase KdpD
MHQASSTPTPPTESPQPDVLGRLTDLSRELAGAYQPATVIARLAEAITELLAPSRLTILLLDPATNRLHLAYHRGGDAPHVDAPLLQLPLRRGPMVFSHHVLEEAARHGVAVTEPVAAWMGAPLVAAGRTIGVAAVASNRVEAYGPAESTLLTAMLAQAAIALENARLLELLSSGKRQWELTVDVIHQAICIVDAQGIVRRANRVFADLVRTPVTALPGTPWMSLLPPAWAAVVSRALVEPGAHEIRNGDQVYTVSAVRMEGADDEAAVLSFEEHTEKRRLQDQLIQSEKMSAIGQLIAGIAHDLNNPLASVVGFADFLAESGDVPPALAEPLRVIRQEASVSPSPSSHCWNRSSDC